MNSTSTSGWYAIQNGLNNNLDRHVTNTSPSTRQATVLTDGIYTMMLVLLFFLGKYTFEIVSPQAYVAHANVHHLHVGRTCCHHWMSTNQSPSWPYDYTIEDMHGGGLAEVCPRRYMCIILLQVNNSYLFMLKFLEWYLLWSVLWTEYFDIGESLYDMGIKTLGQWV